MSEHTPGPWVANCYPNIEAAIKDEGGWEWARGIPDAFNGGPVGSVWSGTEDNQTGLPGSIETSAANARLIAAAPDLLEALKEAIGLVDEWEYHPEMLQRFESLIAKSEGK